MSDQKSLEAFIPGLDIRKAKRYSRIKLAVLLVSTLWSVVRLLWFGRGRSAALRDRLERRAPDRRFVVPAFVAIASLGAWLSSLPLDFVGGYLVERRFGLTKQRPNGWLADEAKGLGVSLALGVPLTTGAYAVIRRRPSDWWLVLSAAAVPLAVVASNLAPVLLMPIFNRFEPLRDRRRAERIRALAGKAGVRIADVYQMDMSRQTEKPNAMFAGVGNTKRIVLADTLLDRFADDEIDGIVAHELGHQVHGDIWRSIAVSGALGFISARALDRLATGLVARFGARHGVRSLGDIASLPWLGLALTAIGFVTAPLIAAYSRAIERRADRYAVDLTGDGAVYAGALGRLASESLADPKPPRAVVWMLYSHPPIAERIAAAHAAEAN
jgi:Zn-dependent protease with chaperone function